MLCTIATAVLSASLVHAQDNPYRAVAGVWATLPDGRSWGATNAVYPDRDGVNVWAADRCGENTCVGHDDLDTIFLFDPAGRVLKRFGAGLFVWPHGLYVDRDGNVWVTDARGEQGKGHQVHKFSPDGKLLLSLGKPGVAGRGTDTFDRPSAVLVAPNGDIFVGDGHGADGANRVVKFTAGGRFLKAWGVTGAANGEFREPHSLAMDSRGRLFVADRHNNRIQIFDQYGRHLANWTQFGRPSGIYIDARDMMYVADSESNSKTNPGWQRGIRIGSAQDGAVTAFIPDTEPDPETVGTSGAEGVAADAAGNVYGAEAGPRMLRKYVR